MKKLIAVLLSVVLLCSAFPQIGYAAGEFQPTIQVASGSTNGKVGDTITVTVSIPSNTKAVGGEFSLLYDSDKMTVVTAAKGKFIADLPNASSMINTNNAGIVKMVIADFGDAWTAGGVLLTVDFELTAAGDAVLSTSGFQLSDYDLEDLPVIEATPVTVTIAPAQTTPVAVTGITLSPTQITMGVGGTQAITATVAPTNAANKEASWISSDESVATVTDKGVVTAVAVGTATITATTKDGGFKATCAVTVQEIDTETLFLEVSAPTKVSKNADTLEVDINITSNPGIIATKLQLAYDADWFTLKEVKDTQLLEGGTLSSAAADMKSPYTLLWSTTGASNNTSTGTIATLVFEINKTKVGSDGEVETIPTEAYAFNLTNIQTLDKDLEEINVSASGASVQVVLYGDVDANGVVELKDSVILNRYLAEWEDYQTIDKDAADVYFDSLIDVTDGVVLARHLANWTEYKNLPIIPSEEQTQANNIQVIGSENDSAPTVSLDVHEPVGNTVKVDVVVSNNPGIPALQLKFTYDSDNFTITNVQDTGLLSSLSTAHHTNYSRNPYILQWIGATASDANGIVATIELEIAEDIQDGDYSFDIVNVEANDNNLKKVRFRAISGIFVCGEKPESKNLVSIVAPDAIIVANGTAISDFNLPSTVIINLDKGAPVNADVIWNTQNIGYDPNNKAEQILTINGIVELPNDVKNPNSVSLIIPIKVTVEAVVNPNLVSIVAPDAIIVANGEAISDFNLPNVVSINLDNGKSMNASVTWNTQNIGYNPNNKAEQILTIHGTVTLPEGVDNLSNVSLATTIRVTVKAAAIVNPNLVSIVAPKAIIVANGTAISAFNLPDFVALNLDDNSSSMNASVTWATQNIGYDPNNKAEQVLTIYGTVTLPKGVENPNNIALITAIKVTVEAASVTPPPPPPVVVDPVKLAQPAGLTFNNGIASWTIVPHASEYALRLYKGRTLLSEISTTSPRYDFSSLIYESGSYYYEIYAVGDNTQYLDSDVVISPVYTVAPSTPIDSNMDYWYWQWIMLSTLKYSVTAQAGIGGSITPAGSTTVSRGDSVTYTITPDDGYEIESLIVDGRTIDAAESYTFKNVMENHSITVTFSEIPAPEEEEPEEEPEVEEEPEEPSEGASDPTSTWRNPFTDVFSTDAYYDAIRFVCEKGLFRGVSDTEFAPTTTMTRAMFVTVLGRLDGVDVSLYTISRFPDVAVGEWYSAYVEWAAENGIVNGYDDGTFGVDDEITIEQAVAIIARYARYIELKMDSEGALSEYADSVSVSEWALSDLQWAVGNGVYVGDNGLLNPQANASRVSVAEMLYAFVALMGE